MKKNISILITIFLCLFCFVGLLACDKNTENPTPQTSSGDDQSEQSSSTQKQEESSLWENSAIRFNYAMQTAETVTCTPYRGKIYLQFTTIAPSVFYVDANKQQGLTSPITESTPKLITDILLYKKSNPNDRTDVPCCIFNGETENNFYYYWKTEELLDECTEYCAVLTLDKEYESFDLFFHAIDKFERTVRFDEDNYAVKVPNEEEISFRVTTSSGTPVFYYRSSTDDPVTGYRPTPPTEPGEYVVKAYVPEDDLYDDAYDVYTFTVVGRCSHEFNDYCTCDKCGKYGGYTLKLGEKVDAVFPALSELTVRAYVKTGNYRIYHYPSAGYNASAYDDQGTHLGNSSVETNKEGYLYFTIENTTSSTETVEFAIYCNHIYQSQSTYNSLKICEKCGSFGGKEIQLNEYYDEQVFQKNYFKLEAKAGTFVYEETSRVATSHYETEVYGRDGTCIGKSNGSSKFEFTLPEDGDYYILISNVDDTVQNILDNGLEFHIHCKEHRYSDAGVCETCDLFRGLLLQSGVSTSFYTIQGEKRYYKIDIQNNSFSSLINADTTNTHGYRLTVYDQEETLIATSTSYLLLREPPNGIYYLVIENLSDEGGCASVQVN